MDDKQPISSVFGTPTAQPTGFGLHITLLMAFDLLKGIIERVGADHKQMGSCQYAKETNGVLVPVCIVGHVFHDLGILRTLIGTESEWHSAKFIPGADLDASGLVCNGPGISASLRTYLASRYGITFENEAWYLLEVAQENQDHRETWAKALNAAAGRVITRFGIEVPKPDHTALLNDYLNTL